MDVETETGVLVPDLTFYISCPACHGVVMMLFVCREKGPWQGHALCAKCFAATKETEHAS